MLVEGKDMVDKLSHSETDAKIKIVILRRITRVAAIEKEKSRALSCFNKPHQNFLQMFFGALIIAQRKFYETPTLKAAFKFADKFFEGFDILPHVEMLIESIIEFGDKAGAIRLVEEVQKGTPLGRVLGSGAAITGKVFGVERVPVVKDQALPAYDPRAIQGRRHRQQPIAGAARLMEAQLVGLRKGADEREGAAADRCRGRCTRAGRAEGADRDAAAPLPAADRAGERPTPRATASRRATSAPRCTSPPEQPARPCS
jgi:hypothetical protein